MFSYLRFMGLILLSCFLIEECVAKEIVPLPADQAFQFKIQFQNPHEIILDWQIMPGYFLYAKKIEIKSEPLVNFSMPQGEFQYDPNRGRFEAFSGHLMIPLTLTEPGINGQLKVKYQGCSKDGFCYPPIDQSYSINAKTQTITEIAKNNLSITNFKNLAKDQHQVFNLLQSHQTLLLLAAFLGFGLLLSFTPCVLPMIPILTGLIVGQAQEVSLKKAFFLSLSYVLGMASAYAAIGFLAAYIGKSLQVWLQTPFFIMLGSVIFIGLAISIFEWYDLLFLSYWQKRFSKTFFSRGGGFINVYLMGIFSTLIISPCVTAPLVGVLFYIADSGQLWLGTFALFLMGIGMGLPLLLIGSTAKKWLPKSGPWMQFVKTLFGILMLFMALWLLSRILTSALTLFLLGLLLFGMAFYFLTYCPKLFHRYLLPRLLGTFFIVISLFFLLGSFFVPEPLARFVFLKPETAQHFVNIHSLSEFTEQLEMAKKEKKILLLDFYADWCESCLVMERQVFLNDEVKAHLKSFILLRIDLSRNTSEDEALMKYFSVLAPPSVLFFKEGRELDADRLVGEINKDQFLMKIKTFNSEPA